MRRLVHGGLSDCKRIMAATCPLLFPHLLHEPQLTKVRAALSEPFNDFPVEYGYLARKVRASNLMLFTKSSIQMSRQFVLPILWPLYLQCGQASTPTYSKSR